MNTNSIKAQKSVRKLIRQIINEAFKGVVVDDDDDDDDDDSSTDLVDDISSEALKGLEDKFIFKTSKDAKESKYYVDVLIPNAKRFCSNPTFKDEEIVSPITEEYFQSNMS